jgi:hypothetical protein
MQSRLPALPWPLTAITSVDAPLPLLAYKTDLEPLQLPPLHSPVPPATSPCPVRATTWRSRHRAIAGCGSSRPPVNVPRDLLSFARRVRRPPEDSRARAPPSPAGPSHPKLTAAGAPPPRSPPPLHLHRPFLRP